MSRDEDSDRSRCFFGMDSSRAEEEGAVVLDCSVEVSPKFFFVCILSSDL